MSVKINPISGVNITERINVQPKPKWRREPTRPTKTLSSEPVNNPKIMSDNVISVYRLNL